MHDMNERQLRGFRAYKRRGNRGGYVELNPGSCAGQARARRPAQQGKGEHPGPLYSYVQQRPVLLYAWHGQPTASSSPLTHNCVCNLMVALLGTSAAGLGVARDPLFVHPPKAEDGGVTWVMVEAAIQRARARQQAFGALALPREVVPGGLHAMLQLSEGVYAFTGYLLRNNVWHRHAVGFNAGASLFYVNPWVVVVEPLDRLFPATFFAKLRLQYGLLLPPQMTLRRLALDVSVPRCSVLPYVVPALLTRPVPSHARKRNARDKQKQRPRKRRRTDV